MIDDDGTADFDAVAAVDGENIYVTWINAKRIFTPEEAEAEDFMTKLAAETEVYAAKIALNGNTGTRRVIIRTNNSLQPVSSNNHFFKIRFFATTGPILSFKKKRPAINARTAPIVVAIEQQIVPITGPKRSPASIANVTPGSASTTHPTTVNTIYNRIARGRLFCTIRFINSRFSAVLM